MDTPANLNLEPTLLGAAWRYKWLVLALTIAFGALAWWYSDSTQAWTATTTLAVQDPRSSIVFQESNRLDPGRYVADQIEIAKSRTVAQSTLATLAAADDPVMIDIEEFLDNVSVGAAEATDLISISYSHPDEDTAVVVANAAADTYRATTSDGAQATFADALAELDATIADLAEELNGTAIELDRLRNENLDRLTIADELQAAIQAALDFQRPSATAEPEEVLLADTQLQELRSRVELLRTALASFQEDERIATVQAEQDEVRTRLSALQLRRDQLAVDAELAGNIVVFSSPAETAEPSSAVVLLVLGSVGGAIVGSVAAQSLARRRRTFRSRNEPSEILQSRLIADIPVFGEERLSTELPAAEAPQSAAAESFRFVATGIQLRQRSSVGGSFTTVAVTSATLGNGKTTVTANTAFAAAAGGQRVALIDADFVNPALTRLLGAGNPNGLGLTDVVSGEATLDEIGATVAGPQGESVTLFRRGTHGSRSPEFFASAQAAKLLRELGDRFDLVLIDAPPVLHLAHSGTVVRIADRVMAVVAHRSAIAVAEELHSYLSVVGVPVLGYVYNFAPLRREMLSRTGSAASGDAEAS